MFPLDAVRFCTTDFAIARTGAMTEVVFEGIEDGGRLKEKTENWGTSCSSRTWARVPSSHLAKELRLCVREKI